MRSQRLLASVALGPVFLLAQPVAAQQRGSSAPVGATAQQPDNQLGEIVVTAQKRSERLQQVPIAITAASGLDMAKRGINSTLELNSIVPGLNIRTASGAAQTFIRGIGTTSNIVENPVALYVDGVYLPQQRDGLRELVDVEQIAVLKGPQGTLFGRNATGGVIQITTLAPRHNFGGLVRAEIDDYATVRGRFYVTGGLAPNVAASLALGYAHQADGYGRSINTGTDTNRLRHEVSGRVKFLLEPSDKTSVTVIADYLDRNQLANSFQPYPGTSLSVPGTGPLNSVYDSYQGANSFIGYRGGGASVTINHDLGFARLISISAARRGNTRFLFDDAAVPGNLFVVRTPNSPNRMYSQELQLISAKNDRFNWVAGVYLYDYRNSSRPLFRDLAGAVATRLRAKQTITTGTELTQSVAPFGQLTYTILPQTHLTLGARYTYEKRHATVSQVGTGLDGSAFTRPTQDESLTIRKPTVRVALDHQFTKDVLGYVSYNTGIKSGGFNIISPGPGYLPEKLTAYEAGLKTEWFDRRLRLNLAGFYYNYSNVQVIQFVGAAQAVVNGAKARLYGLDIDFEARPLPGLRLSGGAEIEHTEFTDYKAAIFGTPIPGGGAALRTGNATGNRLPLAQNLSGTLAMDYEHRLPQGSINFNVSANYNGDYRFEADNLLRQPAYTLVNSSIRWTMPGEKLIFTLFARNLLNEHVITQSTSQFLGYPTAYSNTPRSFGAAVEAKF